MSAASTRTDVTAARRSRCAIVRSVHTSTTDAQATAAPTDGRHVYKLDRTGRKTVIARPHANQTSPHTATRERRQSRPTVGRAKHHRRAVAATENVQDRSTYWRRF